MTNIYFDTSSGTTTQWTRIDDEQKLSLSYDAWNESVRVTWYVNDRELLEKWCSIEEARESAQFVDLPSLIAHTGNKLANEMFSSPTLKLVLLAEREKEIEVIQKQFS